MVKEILTAAGIQERGSRFLKPPAGTYAVWFVDIAATAPDHAPACIFTHNVTIELYEPKKDEAAVDALEAELTGRGLEWTKQDRLWISSEQMYQTVYEFTHTKKKEDVTNEAR